MGKISSRQRENKSQDAQSGETWACYGRIVHIPPFLCTTQKGLERERPKTVASAGFFDFLNCQAKKMGSDQRFLRK